MKSLGMVNKQFQTPEISKQEKESEINAQLEAIYHK